MRIVLKAGALKEIAARRGITLGEVAQRATIHPAHLSKILAGAHALTPKKRVALLAALGVGFDALFEIVYDGDALHA